MGTMRGCSSQILILYGLGVFKENDATQKKTCRKRLQ